MATLAELAEHGISGSADVLPVPVGPVSRTLDVVEDELAGANLSLFEEELETARLRLALASAKRGRRELRARVAELEAERAADHETWQHDLRTARSEREATAVRVAELETDLAAKAQDAEAAANGCGRARDRIAELEAERHTTNEALDDAVQELRTRRDDVTPQVQKLRALLAGQRAQSGGAR